MQNRSGGTRLERAIRTTLTATRANEVFGRGNWVRGGPFNLPIRVGGYRQEEGKNRRGRPVLIKQR